MNHNVSMLMVKLVAWEYHFYPYLQYIMLRNRLGMDL
nr:MAG: hypothetical protein [Microviridae sp.]